MLAATHKRLQHLETLVGAADRGLVVTIPCRTCGASKLLGDLTPCGEHQPIPTTGRTTINIAFVKAQARQQEITA